MSTALVPGFPYPPPLFGELREIFRLRPKVPLSEWSEANIVLSPEYSNSTGPLMLFGWQRAIFDAISGSEPAGLNAYSLIAVLAGVEAARWSIFFGAWVSWLRMWEWMSALLRANMLAGALFDPGPASERLPRSAGEAVTRFRDDVEDIVWFVDGFKTRYRVIANRGVNDGAVTSGELLDFVGAQAGIKMGSV
jgi:hypothetical protein